ncbi:MAG: response regulator transcription factor [Acidobacteria bacterium]|nr:response regulator transcription factor [Acidobacteriota bacterium]
MQTFVTPTRIVIADDHALFRDGLRMVFQSESDMQVVGEAADGQQTIDLLKNVEADVLLLDLNMPRVKGMDVLRTLAPLDDRLKVIVLTASIDKKQILECLKLGARGVVLKESAAEVLLKCIRAVGAGQFWLGQEPVPDLWQAFQNVSPGRKYQPATQHPFGLTAREREIVATVVEGCSNREIANRYSLSEDTVKHHLTNIFDKLGVSSRLELAMAALHHGLVEQS